MSVVATGAVALALAAPAAAHVEVTPTRVAPLSAVRFVFTVPNERPRGAIVGLRLSLPVGLVLGEVQLLSGWSARVGHREVVWRGGPVPPGEFARFSLLATATGRRGVLPIRAEELFADGAVEHFRPAVTVGSPGSPAPRAGHDSGARTLGKFALAVGLAALVVSVTVGFGLLVLRLTRPEV